MRKHFQYLKYLLRHKWFVFIGCRILGVPLWQSIIHDLSKFYPSEWNAYAEYFYGSKTVETEAAFEQAWNHHQKRNPHHWQYWILIRDNLQPSIIAIPMPIVYIREMIADWYGAGRAITGKVEIREWYENNKDKIALHPITRISVEFYLEKYF